MNMKQKIEALEKHVSVFEENLKKYTNSITQNIC